MRKLILLICLMLTISVSAATDSLALLRQLRFEKQNIANSLTAIEIELANLRRQLSDLKHENELQQNLLFERKNNLERQKKWLAAQAVELEVREKQLVEWENSWTSLKIAFKNYRETAETRLYRLERANKLLRWSVAGGAAIGIFGLVRGNLR